MVETVDLWETVLVPPKPQMVETVDLQETVLVSP
jgi:hypothetical protein